MSARIDLTGLTALNGPATTLLKTLDAVFETWGTSTGAESMIMPPLLPVEMLAKVDFYDNFPHQALLVSPLDMAKRDTGVSTSVTSFPPEVLEPSGLALPSAACFAVYLVHQGKRLPAGRTVTVLGRCFRREDHYVSLRRLLGFHMREVVALGSREFAQDHLDQFSARIESFVAALDLPVQRQPATDPFYDRGGQRALMQKLSPVKHEYLVGDLAIASVNVHRNFFGERCDIQIAGSGQPVFTSCAAFGLERWLSVLFDRFGNWEAATEAVEKAARFESLERTVQ